MWIPWLSVWNTSLTSSSRLGCHQASQGLTPKRRDAQKMQGNNLWVILHCRLIKMFFPEVLKGREDIKFCFWMFSQLKEASLRYAGNPTCRASGPQDWWLSQSCLCSRTGSYFWKPSNMPSGLWPPRFSFWRCFLWELCMLFPKELLPSRLPHLYPFPFLLPMNTAVAPSWQVPTYPDCFQLSALDKWETKREVDRKFI